MTNRLRELTPKGVERGYIKEQYGKSKQLRFLNGHPLIPIGYIRTRDAQHKKKSVNRYTPEGRAEIHKNLGINTDTMIWLMQNPVLDKSIEFKDNIISFPLVKDIPSDLAPLIIPPGKDKYRNTYKEPFRSVISKADAAFIQAGAFLCAGYGFNDEHIQPKLIAEIEKGRPVVVLARTMTDSCKRLVVDSSANRFLILEYASDGKTRVHGKGWTEEYDGEFWKLDEFMKIRQEEKWIYLTIQKMNFLVP